MDASRFDMLARATASARSRRAVLGATLGALAAGVLTERAEAAAKRRNGEICRKGGDCLSGVCAPKDATGRRRCECATECVMLDDSPGDCSSGFCACTSCPASDSYLCVRNTAGRYAQGIFFVLQDSIDAASLDDPLAGLQPVSPGELVTAAEGQCSLDSDCPNPFAEIICTPSQPFCIEGGTCAVFFDCRDDGPVGPC